MIKSFEKAMARLEEIAALLEDGSQTLEDSLKLFEEANELALFCEKQLDNAEKKLKILTKNGQEFKIQEEMF